MRSRRLVAALTATAALLASLACQASKPAELIPLTGRPSAVAVLGDVVWIADDATHSVRAIDASSGGAIGRPIRVERNPIALAAERGSVWVAHASGTIVRIDTRTRRTDEPIKAGGSITGIAVRGSRVWATDINANAVVEIDARTSRIRRVFRVTRGVVRVGIAGTFLWVTNRESTATRLDPRSGEVGPAVDVGLGPIGLAFDGRRVWVANSDDGTISRIDASSGRQLGAAVYVGNGPIGVTVAAGVVWVANQDDSTLTRVDPRRGERMGEPIELGLRPRGVAAGSGAVWAVGANRSGVVRVDLE